MNDMFAALYETVFQIFDSTYEIIYYYVLFDKGIYTIFGLTFIIVPIVVLLVYYLLIRWPYSSIWHWVVAIIVSIVIIGLITINVFNTAVFGTELEELQRLLANPDSGYEDHATWLSIKYSIVNALLGLLIGILFSLFIKRFSKFHSQIPV